VTFEEIVDQALTMLQRRGRLTHGTLKRQLQLDDAAWGDLKNELIEGQRLAVDERGNVLVWIGAAGPASPVPSPSANTQEHAPRTYTPLYLAEKILTSKTAREGEGSVANFNFWGKNRKSDIRNSIAYRLQNS
jgi:hypothetical protein